MELVKLAGVFALIVLVMALKKPLFMAMMAAGIGTIILYGLPLDVTLQALWKGLTGKTTINAILVIYTITFLQRMLEKRGDLRNCQTALNGLFNNRRINASVAPFLLGCLPGASTVVICGPIVRSSVGDYLTTPEQASITSFFRHITEAFLPTYTAIFIAIGLTEGKVTAGTFVLAMLPMVAALFLTGWLVYLRRVPKDTGMTPDQSKPYYWKLLIQSVWTIFLSIVIILGLDLFGINCPVYLAVLVCVALNFFVNRFSFSEILPFFRSAFEVKLVVNTIMVMMFKELLSATGVITALPDYLSRLPVPSFLTFALIFFLGAIVAGSQAIIVLCMPMAMASLNGGPALAFFILLMCMNYVAMQISPIHICLTLCAEDFKVPLGSMIAKTVPMVAVFTLLSFGYYFLLSAFGL